MVRVVATKRGLRCLGIAESFLKTKPKSILAGVVQRRDLFIDGVAISSATVGGLDATEAVLNIYSQLNRRDISFILLSGCVISWFNIIDVDRVYEETGVPVICVTYNESQGLEKFIEEYFQGQEREKRLKLYRKLGERKEVYIRKTGARVYVRNVGMSLRTARELLNIFTHFGGYPEPVRVANLIARAVLRLNY